MSPILAADPTFGERFIREAKIVAKLAHKNIVTVYDAGESGNFYYLAMEYMPGGDLKNKIEKGMKARECLSIIGKISTALHFAHEKGYIHRDVKSENILFNEADEPFLTDFGIAKASNSSTQMTQTGKLIGTPEYMSPEQCRGKTIDGRSDLYSLGIILFEMLTRKVPFSGEDSVSVCIKHVTQPLPELPARLKHFQWLLELLLAKDPAVRFQTGVELTKAVEEFKNTGQKTTDIGKKDIVAASQSPSRTVTNSDSSVDDVESGSDFIDDLHTEKRQTNINDKPKSNIRNVVIFFFVGLLITVGYLTQDKWFDKGYQWVQTNLMNKPNSSTIDKPSTNGVTANQSSDKNKSKEAKIANTEQTDGNNKAQDLTADSNLDNNSHLNQKDTNAENKTPNVGELLEQADRLVQYTPRKLADIKQALNLIATINTIEPDNKNSNVIYQNILSYSLEEATKLANQYDFDKADEWTALVEFKQPDYVLLSSTKQNIQRIKLEYKSKETERLAHQLEIKDLLAKAEQAIKENKLSSPSKRNAVHYYQKILELEPDNQEAILGLDNIEASYIAMIEKSISNKAYTKAKSLLVKLAGISDNEVQHNNLLQKIAQGEKKNAAALKERRRLDAIALELEKAELARAERLNDPLVAMQLKSSLNSARKLENDMQLVLPESNNAKEKYIAVLNIDDRNEEAKAGLLRIEQLIITNLRNAITVSDRNLALEWLEKLRLFNAEHALLVELENLIIDIKEEVKDPEIPDSSVTPNIKTNPAEVDNNTKVMDDTNESNIVDKDELNKNPEVSINETAKIIQEPIQDVTQDVTEDSTQDSTDDDD